MDQLGALSADLILTDSINDRFPVAFGPNAEIVHERRVNFGQIFFSFVGKMTE